MEGLKKSDFVKFAKSKGYSHESSTEAVEDFSWALGVPVPDDSHPVWVWAADVYPE